MKNQMYLNSNTELQKFILRDKEAAFRTDIEKSEQKMKEARSKKHIREQLLREKNISVLINHILFYKK